LLFVHNGRKKWTKLKTCSNGQKYNSHYELRVEKKTKKSTTAQDNTTNGNNYSYPKSVAYYDTQSRQEVGLLYSSKAHAVQTQTQ